MGSNLAVAIADLKVEENIEWFEVDGDRTEDIQIYYDHNPGGIGMEDIDEEQSMSSDPMPCHHRN